MGQAKQSQKVSENVAVSLNQSRAAADMEMQIASPCDGHIFTQLQAGPGPDGRARQSYEP